MKITREIMIVFENVYHRIAMIIGKRICAMEGKHKWSQIRTVEEMYSTNPAMEIKTCKRCGEMVYRPKGTTFWYRKRPQK